MKESRQWGGVGSRITRDGLGRKWDLGGRPSCPSYGCERKGCRASDPMPMPMPGSKEGTENTILLISFHETTGLGPARSRNLWPDATYFSLMGLKKTLRSCPLICWP